MRIIKFVIVILLFNATLLFGNLMVSVRNVAQGIKRCVGFTSVLSDSLNINNSFGITWDGTNLMVVNAAAATIYKHSGFTLTVLDLISIGNIAGLEWDIANADLLVGDYNLDKVYKMDGFSGTKTDSVTVWDDLRGVAWDGTNLWVVKVSTDKKVYRLNGFSNTKTADSLVFSTTVCGIAWDGTNLLVADETAGKVYKYAGTTKTDSVVLSQYAGNLWGVTWQPAAPSVSKTKIHRIGRSW